MRCSPRPWLGLVKELPLKRTGVIQGRPPSLREMPRTCASDPKLSSIGGPNDLDHTAGGVQPDAVAVLEPSGGVLHIG